MTLADLMSRSYDREHYNCAHFATDVWYLETREDIGPLILPMGQGPRPSRELARTFTQRDRKYITLGLVVLSRKKGDSHVGVYKKKHILHLPEGGIPQRVPPSVAMIGYNLCRYYCRI